MIFRGQRKHTCVLERRIELDHARAGAAKIDFPECAGRRSCREQRAVPVKNKGAETHVPVLFSEQADVVLGKLQTKRINARQSRQHGAVNQHGPRCIHRNISRAGNARRDTRRLQDQGCDERHVPGTPIAGVCDILLFG